MAVAGRLKVAVAGPLPRPGVCGAPTCNPLPVPPYLYTHEMPAR